MCFLCIYIFLQGLLHLLISCLLLKAIQQLLTTLKLTTGILTCLKKSPTPLVNENMVFLGKGLVAAVFL